MKKREVGNQLTCTSAHCAAQLLDIPASHKPLYCCLNSSHGYTHVSISQHASLQEPLQLPFQCPESQTKLDGVEPLPSSLFLHSAERRIQIGHSFHPDIVFSKLPNKLKNCNVTLPQQNLQFK